MVISAIVRFWKSMNKTGNSPKVADTFKNDLKLFSSKFITHSLTWTNQITQDSLHICALFSVFQKKYKPRSLKDDGHPSISIKLKKWNCESNIATLTTKLRVFIMPVRAMGDTIAHPLFWNTAMEFFISETKSSLIILLRWSVLSCIFWLVRTRSEQNSLVFVRLHLAWGDYVCASDSMTIRPL